MNQLKHSTSLYLRQHQNNPVAWRLWGKNALNEAKKQRKPILLSSGYAACHWCHVMAAESFEDPAIAEIINQHFIPIKIDREERPEIDALYMEALQSLGQPGGWPLTMFLDEDANPFWGGSYFPNPARHGQVGFADVLKAVVKIWETQKEQVAKNRDALREIAQQKMERKTSGTIEIKIVKRMAKQLTDNFDAERGGLRGAPKFPNLPMVDFLWAEALAAGADSKTSACVIKTLEAICLGGIYDHLGGGVARYAVDENWRVPHFEKMLYDNGLLLWTLSEVYRETQSPLFEERIREIISFLQREMLLDGGLAASLDADSINADGKKQEGAYYVWQADEIDKLLGEGEGGAAAAAEFRQAYGITSNGNWVEENTNVLFLETFQPAVAGAAVAGAGGAAAGAGAASGAGTHEKEKEKEILLAARHNRAAPARDEKVMASWNGFAIHGIAHAAWVLGDKNYLALAENIFARVEKTLMKDGRLCHSACDGQVVAPCLLDDLAATAQGAMTLYFITQKENYLARAKAYLQEALTYFPAEGNVFYQAAADAEDIPLGKMGRAIEAHDNVMPAAHSLLWQLSLHLFLLEGKTNYLSLAESIREGFGGDVVKNFPAHASWLACLRREQKLLQIVLVKDDGQLEDALRALSLPHTPIIKVADPDSLPADHPAFHKRAIDNKPTAFVCLGNRCLPPLVDKKILTEVLLEARVQED